MAGKLQEEEAEEGEESKPGTYIQSAGADVTEASQKRKWLQERGIEETGCGSRGALHDGVRRPAAALCKSPGGPGRVTVKHPVPPGTDLHAVQARPGRRPNGHSRASTTH